MKLYTVKSLARHLGLSYTQTLRLVRSGVVRALRAGNIYLIPGSSLTGLGETWRRRRGRPPGSPNKPKSYTNHAQAVDSIGEGK